MNTTWMFSTFMPKYFFPGKAQAFLSFYSEFGVLCNRAPTQKSSWIIHFKKTTLPGAVGETEQKANVVAL